MRIKYFLGSFLFFYLILVNNVSASTDLIRVVHSDQSVSVYNATSSSDSAQGQALLTAIAAAVDGDSVYLSSGTFDITGSMISLYKPSTLITPIFHYGSGDKVTGGISYKYHISALVNGTWVSAYDTNMLPDNNSGNNFYIQVTWPAVPNASMYQIDFFTDDAGSWFASYATTSLTFNDGDGTVFDSYQYQMPTGHINLHGSGKYDTIIKSTNVEDGIPVLSFADGSEVSDLSLVDLNTSGYKYIISNNLSGDYGDNGFIHASFKNIYVHGITDGFYVNLNQSGVPPVTDISSTLVNVSIDTKYDTFNWSSRNRVNIYQSDITATVNPLLFVGAYSRGIQGVAANVINSYNTIINVSGSDAANYAVSTNNNSLVNLFGGSLSSSGTGAKDIFIGTGGVNVTVETSYDHQKTTGTINTISAVAPMITDATSTLIGAASATLNAMLLTDGGATTTVRGFNFGKTSSYGQSASSTGEYIFGAFSQDLTNLDCGAVYHYQAFASNIIGSTSTSDQTFTTNPCPTVTIPSSSITTVSHSGGFVSPSYLATLLAPSASTTVYLNSLKTSPTITGTFNRSLQMGSSGSDVKNLQKYLNTHGFLVAVTGLGSLNHETIYFGLLTQKALAKFQAVHNILPSIGYFGPKTRSYIISSEAVQ
ncbi:MAG TPA: peptidoglycan-binding domain-containing protein [Candidatus Paceibacterota bacterium]|jgi:hypothetical protein|nr:peptidoglycan-binding domain-containing protein [Candidatus Paceibacterota bacterium]